MHVIIESNRQQCKKHPLYKKEAASCSNSRAQQENIPLLPTRHTQVLTPAQGQSAVFGWLKSLLIKKFKNIAVSLLPTISASTFYGPTLYDPHLLRAPPADLRTETQAPLTEDGCVAPTVWPHRLLRLSHLPLESHPILHLVLCLLHTPLDY